MRVKMFEQLKTKRFVFRSKWDILKIVLVESLESANKC